MIKKDCFLLDINEYNSIAIYVSIDALEDFAKKILKKADKKKKFDYIVVNIYRNKAVKSIYEEYSNYKGTATIKIGRGQDNLRIYCKVESVMSNELKQKRITLHKVWSKKVQQLSNKEIGFLTAIQKIEFNYGRFINK